MLSLLSLVTGRGQQHEAVAERPGPPGADVCPGTQQVSWAVTTSTRPSEDGGRLGSHLSGDEAGARVLQLCPGRAGRVESAGKGNVHCILASIWDITGCPRLPQGGRRLQDMSMWTF